jgi:predicted neuraminidase
MVTLALACLLMNSSENPGNVSLLKSDFIYESAPFPSCHAAAIEQAPSGKILAAWFGGTAESNPDVAIYLSELKGEKWTLPRQIALGYSPNGERRACYNPVLFQPSQGPLLLFYKVGTGPQAWWGMMTRSYDEGLTWDEPTRLPEGIFGPIKNRPIEIGDGAIISPSSTEDKGWRVHFERSNDFGSTWTKGEAVNDGREIGAIQPSILRLGGTRLRAIGRTQQGRVFSIDSEDNGRSWGKMKLLIVLNPNSGCDAATLKDGRHLLIYNNSPNGRTPLSAAVSPDGENWTDAAILESEAGEYSYPSLIQAKNGLVHIVYTWKRQRIKHAVLKVN